TPRRSTHFSSSASRTPDGSGPRSRLPTNERHGDCWGARSRSLGNMSTYSRGTASRPPGDGKQMRADSAVSTVTDQMFPLRLGGGDAFSHVASFLKSARFDEETLCRILGIPSMAEFGSVRPHEVDLAGADSPLLALLVRLFLFIEPVTGEEVARAIEPAVLRALLDLDLLRPYPAPGDSAAYCAPVLLYPVAGLLIASDRHENPDRSSFVPPADVVFPAIFAGTLRFLKILPTTSVEDVLDLCAGTGIGALALSRHVQRAVAADITGRATHFARFNCLLNRCANVEVAQGDLYQPVDGRTFD